MTAESPAGRPSPSPRIRPARRLSPLARLEPVSSADLRIAELPFLTQINLRVDPESGTAADLALALGVPLPTEPGVFVNAVPGTPTGGVHGSGAQVLWLGPDEWLVVAAPDDIGLEGRLRIAAGTGHAGVTDVSAQRTVLRVTGPRARDLLAHGCPLDLHPRVFGPGRCAQTTLARAQVLLVAGEGDVFDVFVRSSFAGYLAAWLLDAAVEYLDG